MILTLSSSSSYDFNYQVRGYLLTEVSKLTPTLTTFLKFRLTMKLHIVFYCTGLCEPRCNELHVTFVYEMDADMYKAVETILSLSYCFCIFAVVFKLIRPVK